MTFCSGCGTHTADGTIMCAACSSRTAEDKKTRLVANPFDSRSEVSADARHIAENQAALTRNEVSADARHIAGKIVSHMWIIFVLLPIVLGVLFAVLTAK
jgi:hypothetical protein